MNICLIGYYGKGNFGDDLLLAVTYNIATAAFPSARISIFCDSYDDPYLSHLLPNQFEIVRPGNRRTFDLIIHGGGGNFHDYGSYGLLDRFLGYAIRQIGYRSYVSLDRSIRQLTGRQRMRSSKRLGWGIGVGTFAPGSPRLRHALPELLTFDELFVRDRISLENLEALGLYGLATLGSDLAFLWDNWSTTPPQGKPLMIGRPKVGLILRDWPGCEMEEIFQCSGRILEVLENDFDVTLFIFDKRDTKTIATFASIETHIWSAAEFSIKSFLNLIAQQDVVISSRAHGAICAAVLGRPSLILEIEPKLKTIHELLPASSRLLSPFDLLNEGMKERINSALSIPSSYISEDVSRNRRLARSSLLSSRNYVEPLTRALDRAA